ncbi:2'-5' RNA ligase family protein [Bacillus paramycoides]|uniref:2'-5' RNA ligase family protein n=1 Tax=Bacillus paramycoides TaxID=2026194 RepID=UPI0015BFA3D4|nr:2'-5' RNA ligase family protein [Bacillus paramycoides]NWK69829.1 2'-5' RNA ligase family protein [Bacillus paramycoides]
MYGVIAKFDEKTEQIIKDIWRELREKSISFYVDEVVNRVPHITLASYNEIDKNEFIEQIDKFYDDKVGFEITFNSIGSFLHSGTLFLSPTINRQLLEFHSNHHKNFIKYNDNPNSLYLPDKWLPHCTLANRLTPEKLSEAFTYCLKRNDTIKGMIEEIAILEIVCKNNVPIIFSKRLNNN